MFQLPDVAVLLEAFANPRFRRSTVSCFNLVFDGSEHLCEKDCYGSMSLVLQARRIPSEESHSCWALASVTS